MPNYGEIVARFLSQLRRRSDEQLPLFRSSQSGDQWQHVPIPDYRATGGGGKTGEGGATAGCSLRPWGSFMSMSSYQQGPIAQRQMSGDLDIDISMPPARAPRVPRWALMAGAAATFWAVARAAGRAGLFGSPGSSAASLVPSQPVFPKPNVPMLGAPGPANQPVAHHPKWTANGTGLLKDGEPFDIRGVVWSPPVKGELSWMDYHPENSDFAGYVNRTIELMKHTGFNTARTYVTPPEPIMQAFCKAGLWLLVDVMPSANEAELLSERVAIVSRVPCVIAVNIGNEWNFNKLWKNWHVPEEQVDYEVRKFIGKAAREVHEKAPGLLVSSVHSNMPPADVVLDSHLADVDLWGGNIYPGGLDLANLPAGWDGQFQGNPPKPWYLAEYGADYIRHQRSDQPGVVDREMQKNVVANQTAVMVADEQKHHSFLGGFVFAAFDERKCWEPNVGQGIYCGFCVPPNPDGSGGMGPGAYFQDFCWDENHFGIFKDPAPSAELAMTPASRAIRDVFRCQKCGRPTCPECGRLIPPQRLDGPLN